MGPLRTEFGFVVLLILPWFLSVVADEPKPATPGCDFPAIFNFGDSNSDTGCMSSAFYPAILPYGQTFFHDAAGRASDGRLIIDFIAEKLGFPYLSAYIDSIGTSYRHGANFAAGSSTIRRQNRTYFDGGSPFTLEIQTAQFVQFKARTAKFFNQGKENPYTVNFPRPEEFAKAIYTFDIGQNDIALGMGHQDSQALISDMLENFLKQIKILYEQGARAFWIHNTGPIGCLPLSMPKHNANNNTAVQTFNSFWHIKENTVENQKENDVAVSGSLDENGCVIYANDIAKDFNSKLKNGVLKLRAQYPDASFTYVDMFSAKYELISNSKREGFVDPSEICCGYHEDGYHVNCGNKAMIKGKEIYAGSCKDPSKYISWDGVHYTEAANRWIANRILNGSLSDPPLPITHSCKRTP
ncbi:GDSL esterase/lipase At5g14450-like [Arachis stenosperma]|uniref:GDSL esterase/lipase At5g14450-like n=1 Tax=Arachis stenosperma TaxID=217475 RepID=UPI0025AC4729|nr:GDSL esterase/lipase At5g14450-like [Arachis stenosperma]